MPTITSGKRQPAMSAHVDHPIEQARNQNAQPALKTAHEGVQIRFTIGTERVVQRSKWNGQIVVSIAIETTKQAARPHQRPSFRRDVQGPRNSCPAITPNSIVTIDGMKLSV